VPFLRVIRDKRGYETTYLMHWYREGSKQRSRILYVFRTPGGARVGRDSLEPEVQRAIEAQHPDIAFDWKSVLANRQIIESAPEPRRRKKKSGEGDAPPAPVEAAAEATPPQKTQPPAAPRFTIPGAMQGETQEERIAFLNHWYPLIRDRVPVRTSDPVRREALLALAERLNPAAWTDEEQVTAGLQRAGEALERLSRVFSRRRRRARRSSKPAGTPPTPEQPPPADA
jgi:hypothetical protein